MRVKTDKGSFDVKTVELLEDTEYFLKMIDQRLLPHQLSFVTTRSSNDSINLISDMAVRGAPAIGATGAYAFVLALQEDQQANLEEVKRRIVAARPTAKDLETFVNKMVEFSSTTSRDIKQVAKFAKSLAQASEDECKAIGKVAEHLIEDGMGVLTHCNAGALATVDYGTALAPMRFARYAGRTFKVYVDETRPRLQGMLTAWELANEDIDYEIIVDNAAGFFMQQGRIDLVITGTDRVLADGTVTNKIGTMEKAIVAHSFGIPVYIAMPWTTFDPDISSSDDIPIEFRSDQEINLIRGDRGWTRVSPEGAKVNNPAFDITDAKYITGYITKDGILSKDQLVEYYNRLNQ